MLTICSDLRRLFLEELEVFLCVAGFGLTAHLTLAAFILVSVDVHFYDAHYKSLIINLFLCYIHRLES